VQLPLRTAVVAPIVGVMALLYPRLKQVPLLKTLVVALVWTWCAIALPYGDGSWFGWRGLLLPVALPVMLLMASGCLLCDLKDESLDRAAGVRSGPALFGATRTTQLALMLAGAAAIAAALEHRPALLVTGCALGLATLWPKTLARDAVGPLCVDMILTLPGVLIVTHVV
jgi:4-hydroxybenzoate polyprenyltransferase